MSAASRQRVPPGGSGIIAPDKRAAIDRRVDVAQFNAFNRQGRISNIASPLIASFVAYIMWDEAESGRVVFWLACIGVVGVARAAAHHLSARAIDATEQVCRRWKLLVLTMIFLSGLAWGSGTVLLFPQDSFILQSFLIVVVLGMGAGATASFAPYFPALAAYIIPLSLPIATILVAQQTTLHGVLGTFGFIFLAILLLLGRAGQRNFTSLVRLDFENAHLAHGLASVERRLADAVDSMSEAVALFDADDRLVLTNERMGRLVPRLSGETGAGISFGDFLDLLAARVSFDDQSHERGAWLEDMLRRHRAPGEPCELKLRDGRWLRISEQRTSDGGVVAVFSDLTQLKNREAALTESENRYRRLVEASPDLISIHRSGRFVFMNAAGARMIGAASPEQLIGRRVLDFIHPEDHDCVRSAVPAVEIGRGVPFMQFRALRVDRSEFAVEAASLQFVFRGEPAVLTILRDITERKLAEAQLVQTSKLALLGEMAASMAHELNQPLNVIRMAADACMILAEEGKADADYVHRQIERISAQSERMAGIIDHMRVFSRREDGSGDLFDPLDGVREAVSMVQDQFVLDDVRIDVDVPDKSAPVRGNPVRLEQVILNFLTNARDAIVARRSNGTAGRSNRAPLAGRIGVSAHLLRRDGRAPTDAPAPASHVVIRIDDNGGGIPPHMLDRIFDPFFTTKMSGQGTGLGLTIAYSIVNGMGGHITAFNQGDGTAFEMRLPAAASGEAAADDETPVRQTGAIAKET